MKHAMYLATVVALGVTLLFSGNPFVQAENESRNITVALRGDVDGFAGLVPDLSGDGVDDDAICFELDIVDLATGRVIGTAFDCLSNIEGGTNGGVQLVGTTIFNLPGGSLTSRGLTTVQAVNHGSLDFTHITGAVPQAGENGVVEGTGRFANATGEVRLSGAVNLSGFDPSGGAGGDDFGNIAFDCIFVINLD